MSLFGHKERQIIQRQLREIEKLKTERSELARQLREVDHQIFVMANKPNWEAMRPHFTEIAEGAMVRKRAESDRIASIMIPELERTYG